jgi:hypothetical protein
MILSFIKAKRASRSFDSASSDLTCRCDACNSTHKNVQSFSVTTLRANNERKPAAAAAPLLREFARRRQCHSTACVPGRARRSATACGPRTCSNCYKNIVEEAAGHVLKCGVVVQGKRVVFVAAVVPGQTVTYNRCGKEMWRTLMWRRLLCAFGCSTCRELDLC